MRSKTTDKKQPPQWRYGAESDFSLVIRANGIWLTFYSLDVKDKTRPKLAHGNEYSAIQKIEGLQALFEKGGTEGSGRHPGQHFNRLAVDVAYILRKGEKVGDKTCLFKWSAQRQWHRPNCEKKPESRENAAKKGCEWRLRTVSGGIFKYHSLDWDAPEFEHFCDNFPEQYPRLVDRFSDEHGEISRHALMCCYLAAKAAATNAPDVERAYIDRDGNQTFRVDRGRSWAICHIAEGGRWVDRRFFETV